MKKVFLLVVFVLLLVGAVGCAPGPNHVAERPTEEGELAGFWLGLWQGLIAPITFLVSLFSDTVHFYEIHNNGNWYNLGYALGILSSVGGSGGGAARSRCKEGR